MNVLQFLIHGSHELRPYGRGAILLPTRATCIEWSRRCERAMTLRIILGITEADRAVLRRRATKIPA